MIRVKKLEVEMVGGKFNVWAHPMDGGEVIEMVGEGNRLDDLQTIGPVRIKVKTAVVECPGEFEVVETEDGKLIGRLVCR